MINERRLRTRYGMVPICLASKKVVGREWVYSYWDRTGQLLYVGIAADALKRSLDHRAAAPWWRFVKSGGAHNWPVSVSRPLEQRLIRDLRPIFNDKHSLLPRAAIVEYLAQREAWDLVDRYLDNSP